MFLPFKVDHNEDITVYDGPEISKKFDFDDNPVFYEEINTWLKRTKKYWKAAHMVTFVEFDDSCSITTDEFSLVIREDWARIFFSGGLLSGWHQYSKSLDQR